LYTVTDASSLQIRFEKFKSITVCYLSYHKYNGRITIGRIASTCVDDSFIHSNRFFDSVVARKENLAKRKRTERKGRE